ATWLPQHRTTGDHEFDEGSRMDIRQAEFSTKFFSSLFHAPDANPNAVRLQVGNSLANSLAIVSHGNHDLSFPLRQRDPHLLAFRMPEDVGQSLLNNSKNSGLHLGREPGKFGGLNLKGGLNPAALGKPLHVPGKRRQ